MILMGCLLILCIILRIIAFIATQVALARFLMKSLIRKENVLFNLGILILFSLVTFSLFYATWHIYSVVS